MSAPEQTDQNETFASVDLINIAGSIFEEAKRQGFEQSECPFGSLSIFEREGYFALAKAAVCALEYASDDFISAMIEDAPSAYDVTMADKEAYRVMLKAGLMTIQWPALS